MDVFVVLKANRNQFHNDWDTLNYYEEFNCIGVFTTFGLAATSIGDNPNKLIQTVLNDSGVTLGEGWRLENSEYSIFIIKRKLKVE